VKQMQAGQANSKGAELPSTLAARLTPAMRDALGHPLRRQILRLLQAADSPAGAAELAVRMRCAVSVVSYHAQVLETCSTVAPDGTAYSASEAVDGEVAAVLRATRQIDDRLSSKLS